MLQLFSSYVKYEHAEAYLSIIAKCVGLLCMLLIGVFGSGAVLVVSVLSTEKSLEISACHRNLIVILKLALLFC